MVDNTQFRKGDSYKYTFVGIIGILKVRTNMKHRIYIFAHCGVKFKNKAVDF